MQFPEMIVAVAGIALSFGLPLALVGLILYYKLRRQRMTHETIARLAEKGMPVPPELLMPPRGNANLRSGMVLMALGVALSVLMLEVRGPWSVGLIPGLIGLVLLITWAIEERSKPAK